MLFTAEMTSEHQIEESLTSFSPPVGIVSQPIEPISLYASYTRSFQPDRFLSLSVTNTPFEPTIGRQYESGIKADISEQLSATLAAFEITKTNVLTTDTINPDFSIQVGEQKSRGIELDISGEILLGWNIITSKESSCSSQFSGNLPLATKAASGDLTAVFTRRKPQLETQFSK
jgi:outer membrane receptor for ferric coprogen and ferric-rhodotorulic acid